jgi:hypothetical protein
MEFTCRVSPDGGMEFGDRNRVYFKQYLKANPGAVLRITPVFPESNKQRAFLEGAVIPLVTFYQQGMDYRKCDDNRKVREWLKQEFNGELVWIKTKVGKTEAHKIGRSTKGRDVLQPFLERVVLWLIENYDPPAVALDPNEYKRWRDTIFPTGECDHYLEYLNAMGVLTR